MSKITPVITALPFRTIPANYVPGGKIVDPFYFQKTQCVHDQPYGTITDRSHLPAFIIQVPFNAQLGLPKINNSSEMTFEILCPDGSNVENINPVFRWEVIGIINTGNIAAVAAQPPNIGDKYYWDNEDGGDIELYTWNGAGWNQSGQIVPSENDLLNVTSEGIVYAWKPDPKSTDTNPARRGEWIKTNNGFQLCDIGQNTYVIYSGFEVEDDLGEGLPCGLQQLRITFPTVFNVFTGPTWRSELVDLREFNTLNNEYHKLTIDNNCALGNIPYEDIVFNQVYYFEKDGLVGIPEHNIDETQEEDGLGNKKKIFSRTEKLFVLDTQWIPEYIVDFMTFATNHSDIRITFPYAASNVLDVQNQYQGERTIDNDTMTVESNWLEVGCYSQVELKFALEDDIIKTACCQQLDKEGCVISSLDILALVCYDEQDLIESGPPSVGDCYLLKEIADCVVCDIPPCNEFYEHPGEIACWTVEGMWEYTTPEENTIITQISGAGNVDWFYTDLNGWKILNSLDCVPGQYNILVTGYVLSTIVSGYVYYKKATDPFYTLWGIFTGVQLAAGVDITGLPPCTLFDVKILGQSNNCDYGDGPVEQCETLIDGTC